MKPIFTKINIFIAGCPIDLLTDYFKVFGQKPCCFFDLRPYMSLLHGELLNKFLETLSEIVDLKEDEFPKTVSKLTMFTAVCFYFY